MPTKPATIEFGSATITVPESCSRPELFEVLFRKLMAERFESAELAANALAQWKSIRIVPPPFAGNEEAEHSYTHACLALDPDAQAWVHFDEAVFNACLAFDEDGRGQEPAIPGWTPDWIDLAA